MIYISQSWNTWKENSPQRTINKLRSKKQRSLQFHQKRRRISYPNYILLSILGSKMNEHDAIMLIKHLEAQSNCSSSLLEARKKKHVYYMHFFKRLKDIQELITLLLQQIGADGWMAELIQQPSKLQLVQFRSCYSIIRSSLSLSGSLYSGR